MRINSHLQWAQSSKVNLTLRLHTGSIVAEIVFSFLTEQLSILGAFHIHSVDLILASLSHLARLKTLRNFSLKYLLISTVIVMLKSAQYARENLIIP